MVYDIDMLRSFYSNFPKRVDAAREQVVLVELITNIQEVRMLLQS